MKASLMFKLGFACLAGAVVGFALVWCGVEVGRWLAACGVLLGAGAIFAGWAYRRAGKLENDL